MHTHSKTIRFTAVLFTLCLWCGVVSCCASESTSDTEDLRVLFEARYQEWIAARAEWIQQNPVASSTPILPEEKRIEEMGLGVVEFIIELFEKDLQQQKWDNRLRSNHTRMIYMITLKCFPMRERAIEKRYDDHGIEMQLYVDWWREGRKHTPETFASRYKEWDRLEREGKTDEAKKVFDSLRAMGIEILPLVMCKIHEGDERLVSFVSQLMHKEEEWGESPSRVVVQEWWEENKERLRFPDPPTDASDK